jgi:ATP-GRASP peptide maturase of grasp-with-spasm system
MILLFSLNSDFTTQNVCKWLRFYKKKFTLITETNKVKEVKISTNEIQIITQNGDYIDLTEVKNIWYRRGKFFFENDEILKKNNYFDEKIISEMKVVNDYLMYKLNNFDYINQNLNKLVVLEKASKIGFKTPKSLLTYKKNELEKYFFGQRIISKTLEEVIYHQEGDNVYSTSTFEVNLNEISENFKLSFFQELIEKKYEIRTFVFNGKCYSNAIFSQLDEGTKVDYRNYNYTKPNRQVVFKLPIDLERKIFKLLKELKLTSGSIDFIYSKSNNFIFLEVNPIGQFGLVSSVGNFYCEREIALYL